MTSGTRLLALIALIGLSVYLGFLLGKRATNNDIAFDQNPLQDDPGLAASPREPVSAALPGPTGQAPLQTTPRDQTTLRNNVSSRIADLAKRIDSLAAQTDDRLISEQRIRILQELQIGLRTAHDDRFAEVLLYYNQTMPRDGTALLMQSIYLRRKGRLHAAIDGLMTAAEFPESNEQLNQIAREQRDVLADLFDRHAASDDWLTLTDYFESLLLRNPNEDRIRLFLASAQARSGDIDTALATLEITGTEAGVSQQEISELRDSLLLKTAEPIRFRSQGNSLIANATLNSTPIELLVDTGATKTALSTSVLRSLGGRPLNRTAQVMTAAGRITAQLYEVPELVVEETLFRNSVVLALDNPPDNWDGLLGMDLLRDMNVDLSNQ